MGLEPWPRRGKAGHLANCTTGEGRRGTVAVGEEASWIGETGGIEVDSPPSYGTMVCRKAPIVQTACYCVICVWHTYVDDD